MCPNCRAFITIRDRVCPYCEAQVGPRAVDLRPNAFAASFLPSANLSAIILMAINFAFFFGQLALSHSATEVDPRLDVGQSVAILDLGLPLLRLVLQHHFLQFIFSIPLHLHDGQWWRLISAGFLHASWIHILMNSWSLFILVTEVEQFYGTNRLIVAYVVSTITGFLLAAAVSPLYPVLGASCAAFGLMGIMLSMGVFGDRADPFTHLVRQHYGQWLVFGLVMSVLGTNISIAGHVGGLIGGFIVGMIAGRPGHPGSPRELIWKVAAYAGIAVVLLSWYLDFANISVFLKHSAGSM